MWQGWLLKFLKAEGSEGAGQVLKGHRVGAACQLGAPPGGPGANVSSSNIVKSTWRGSAHRA